MHEPLAGAVVCDLSLVLLCVVHVLVLLFKDLLLVLLCADPTFCGHQLVQESALML